MLQPPSGATAALAARLAALAAEADELPTPDPMLDTWRSVAAIEYEAAVTRLAVGLARLRAALHDATAALEAVR
ncbi:MAG TPA: hypothetical protein VGC94_08565 [Amnibacterium sp.]|jgi:hypothetical protein